MSISIRPALASEADVISRLVIRTIQQTNHSDYSIRQIRSTCSYLTPDHVTAAIEKSSFFVAEANTEIVGVAAIRENEITYLYVNPLHQRAGIGRQLIGFLKAKAIKEKAETMKVKASTTAVPFYAKNGFEELKRIERQNSPIVQMQKVLDS